MLDKQWSGSSGQGLMLVVLALLLSCEHRPALRSGHSVDLTLSRDPLSVLLDVPDGSLVTLELTGCGGQARIVLDAGMRPDVSSPLSREAVARARFIAGRTDAISVSAATTCRATVSIADLREADSADHAWWLHELRARGVEARKQGGVGLARAWLAAELPEVRLADRIALLLQLSDILASTEPGAKEAADLARHAAEISGPGGAPAHTTLAIRRYEVGDYAGCAEAADRALVLRLAERVVSGDEVQESRLLAGTCLYLSGDYHTSEERLRLLLASRPTPAHRAEAAATLAEVVRAQGRHDEAETLFREALTPSSLAHLTPNARYDTLNNAAGLYRDIGRLAEAERHMREAEVVAKSIETSDPEASLFAEFNLAEILRLRGQLPEAQPLYAHALERAEKEYASDHVRLATIRHQTGVLAEEMGDSERAERLFREALVAREKAFTGPHPDLALGKADLARVVARHDRAASRSLYAQARRTMENAMGKRHPDVALVMVDALNTLAPEADRAAAVDVRDALRAEGILRRSRANPDALVSVLAWQAWHARRIGSRAASRRLLAESLSIYDRVRPEVGGGERGNASFMAQRADLFREMALWQVEDGELDASLRYAEAGRSRALLDQLAAGGIDAARRIPLSRREVLLARRSSARDAVLRARKQQAALKEESSERNVPTASLQRAAGEVVAAETHFAQVLSQIVDEAALLGTGRGQGQVVTRALRLPAGTLALEYVLGSSRSVVLAVVGDGATRACALRIGPEEAPSLGRPAGELTRASLATLIGGTGIGTGVIDELRSTDPTGPSAARREALGRVLVPSCLESLVRNASEIVVVPDGPLHLVPFSMLWPRSVPTRYAPSLSVLTTLASRRAARVRPAAHTAVLTVGAPIFGKGPDGSTLPPLAWTRRETDGVRQAFEGTGVPVVQLVGLQATEASVRAAMPRARILHFATHGLLDHGGNDLFAALALTAPATIVSSDDDGRLELNEIYEQNLDCRIALLPACSTHRGTLIDGEGVFALSRGFLEAGCDAVLATLWPVGDRCASAVTARFAQEIASSDLDSAALSRALSRAVDEAATAGNCRSASDRRAFILIGV